MPKKAAGKPRRKRTRMRVIVILFFVILALATALAGVLFYLRRQRAPIADPASSQMVLQAITVTGNTHYDDNALIGESGLVVGQNIFSVNKAAAAKKIEAAFPYVAKATVRSPTFNTIEITITEMSVLGAAYADGQWLIIGKNGRLLETMEMQSDRPGRYLYLQNTAPAEKPAVGAQVMDERSLRIADTVLAAVEANALDGVFGIDMRDKTNIALNWKNRLTITLGNESNLTAEIALLAKTLPQILERNSGEISGRLDLSSYSDDTDGNDRIVYTPKESLQTATAAAAQTTGTSASKTAD